MIVKVMGVEQDNYRLWDGIESVYVSKIKSDSKECRETYEVAANIFGKDNPSKGMIISFMKNDIWRDIFFDTIAYICSDEGKTIEVVRG